VLIEGARDVFMALNAQPGGLKLNLELGDFFCDAFLWFLAAWEDGTSAETAMPRLPSSPAHARRAVFLGALLRYLPHVLRIIGVLAYCGSSVALSAILDLLALASLHLSAFHFMTASIYRAHRRLISGLFNIFRSASLRRMVGAAVSGSRGRKVGATTSCANASSRPRMQQTSCCSEQCSSRSASSSSRPWRRSTLSASQCAWSL
jgi:hypothetical protein